MSLVKHHKFVAALPTQLEADSIYYVRVGAGFDIYVTNGAGSVAAYPLNLTDPGQGYFRTEPITATGAGQTSFTVPGGYTPGAIFVSLNGATLPPADFTATNGTIVVLASGEGVVAGSVLLVHVLTAFEVADALPLGGTAADSSKLGGQAPSYYATQADLAGVSPGPEYYQRSNILGTVSESGGVPTGALVQYIKNTNGEAWRFAGGLQICRADLTYPTGSLLETWNLPAAFYDNAYTIAHQVQRASSSTAGSFICEAWPGNSLAAYVKVMVLNSAGLAATGSPVPIKPLTVGRWHA